MSDANAPRPRLVGVSDDPTEAKPPPEAVETSEPTGGKASRRLAWAFAILAVVAVIGLAFQTLSVEALQAENEALAGELFTARSALDAYVARFAEVRQSIEGLQAQLSDLDALVNEDPLAGLATETGSPSDSPGP